MGIPENHPAILQALQRGLILPPPGAPVPEPEADPSLVEPSYWRCGIDPYAVEFRVPLRTMSEANQRVWQGRSRRTGEARKAVSRLFGEALRLLVELAEHYHGGGALDVVLTRLGGKALDRTVNLPSALKGVEDAVALMLGADDGDHRWRCRCEQEPGGRVGVRIRITKGAA